MKKKMLKNNVKIELGSVLSEGMACYYIYLSNLYTQIGQKLPDTVLMPNTHSLLVVVQGQQLWELEMWNADCSILSFRDNSNR